MRNFHIILFIGCVFALLGCICWVFPEDGIELRLKFPSLRDVVADNNSKINIDDSLRSIEDDLIVKIDTVSDVKENKDSLAFIDTLRFYEKFDSTSVARIYFPNNDISVLNKLFAIMEKDTKHRGMLHVLHYGDSQIELDRISGYIRQNLQEHFGGYGVGLLPIVPLIQTTAVSQIVSDSLPRFVASGTMRQKLSHNRYGVLAQMAELKGSVTLTYASRDWKQVFERTKRFTRVRLFLGNNKPNFSATLQTDILDSTQIVKEEKFGLTEISWQLSSAVSSCSIKLKGNAELYGVSLESSIGITVDNIPLRGSSGNFFTSISSSLLRETMSALKVPMIIMEYGGNAVPSLTSIEDVNNYKKNFSQQIKYLQHICPDAVICVIGPADMSTKINGTLQTCPFVEDVNQAMKESAMETGAIFWSMFDVMGGRNSMIQWVSHSPAWAASDYIHFSPLGAKRIAEIFTQSFFHYYDYYKFLQRNEQWLTKEDTDSLEEFNYQDENEEVAEK